MAAETSPARMTARSRRAGITKRKLIEAAIAVFSERGYERATTRELAERAGCSEGLIYKHFGGKRELLLAALTVKRDEGADKYDQIPTDVSLEAAIAALLRRGVTHMWEQRDFMRVCMSLAPIDEAMGRLVETIQQRLVQRLADRLRDLQRAGLVGDDVDIEAAARCLEMLVVGMGYLWQVVFRRDHAEVDAEVVAIANHFSRSLAPAPAPPAAPSRRAQRRQATTAHPPHPTA